MAYSTPITAVSNTALTAAQWNSSVRDDMLVTPAALATTSGSLFAGTGANAIAERIPATTAVLTGETTAGTVYGNLTTAGPSVTCVTGQNALVGIYARQSNSSAGGSTWTTIAVSGATTVAPSDAFAFMYDSPVAGSNIYHSNVILVTGLTAGSNTFFMQYRVSAGTGTFSNRRIFVLPF